MPAAAAGRPGGAETSTRTVQGLLFVLGGLLLGTAATVFTAVAWASVGIAGRALILLAFTALLLAVPMVARWRGLRGTAETFAAVGLLLVVLDGYAVWTVDLLGVAGWPGSRYAGLVAMVSTAVAVGYARLSRLTVPWFAALLAGQPVLPLLAAEARPGPAGWAVVFVGVALIDLAVVVVLQRRRSVAVEGAATTPGMLLGGQVTAGTGYVGALLLAGGCALVPLLVGRAGGVPLLAGVPMLLVALAVFAAALLLGGGTARAVAAGALVPVLAGALLRPAVELRASVSLVLAALIVVALAGAVRLLPAGWRPGPRIGALVVAGGGAAVTALMTVVLANVAVGRSVPAVAGGHGGAGLRLGLATAGRGGPDLVAVGWLLPRAARPSVAAAGVAVTALAVPVAWAAPWPAVVAIDLVVGAALSAAAVARPAGRGATALTSALGGAVLLGHGLLVGLAGPAGAGAACAVILATGLVVAARRPARRAGAAEGGRVRAARGGARGAGRCGGRADRCRGAALVAGPGRAGRRRAAGGRAARAASILARPERVRLGRARRGGGADRSVAAGGTRRGAGDGLRGGGGVAGRAGRVPDPPVGGVAGGRAGPGRGGGAGGRPGGGDGPDHSVRPAARCVVRRPGRAARPGHVAGRSRPGAPRPGGGAGRLAPQRKEGPPCQRLR